MKVALVHDWLTTYAGSERVVEQMLAVYPEADVFSLVDFVPEGQRAFLQGHDVRTSFIQRLPFARKHFRKYLQLFPLAIEQFDLSGYDVVISSSHGVAKGILTGPDQVHVCMCYSPMRWAWDLQAQYLAEMNLERGLRGAYARWLLHRMRIWDMRTVAGVDDYIAISKFIERRIEKLYRRDSSVIYPPVDVDAFTPGEEKEDFYLAASRHVQYKRMPMIVEAFNAMPDKKLVVIGDGPDFERVRKMAGPNVTVLGHQPFTVLRDHMQRAKAYVFAAVEDFGISVVEAQACGTPVIAYGRGGVTETVVPGETGLFFQEQTSAALRDAVLEFERAPPFDAKRIRANAERFGAERFRREFRAFMDDARARHEGRRG